MRSLPDRAQKLLWVLQKNERRASFLENYFTDIRVSLSRVIQSSLVSKNFGRLKPDILFCEAGFLSLPFHQKMKERKETDPLFRLYLLGEQGPAKKISVLKGVFRNAGFGGIPQTLFRDASHA